ncbi:MAG TPA: OmpH family outer membrane protein [Piscirickettsiaceae bacterium]|nr:OmpH family outer membrane protein [Piscirickettsiaceae bacterium]
MNRFLLLVILFSGWSQASLSDDQSVKIGYINIDHLVTSSPQFIQANQEVINEFQPQEKDLVILAQQIQDLADKFNKISKTLNQSERKSEVNKIAKLERQLTQRAAALKKQLELKNFQELGKIQDLINQIIEEVAQEEGFDLILYQQVAYASKKINITPIISQKLRLLFE